MRGAPGKAIQELAGHQELGTTQRYLHLSPAARESAIRLLEQATSEPARGNVGDGGNGKTQVEPLQAVIWLGGWDSNPDNVVQSHVSYL